MGIACIEIYSSAEDMKSSLYILTICFILVHLTSAKPIKDPKELEIEINFVDDEVVVEGQNKARDARNVANKPSDISGSIGGLDLDVVKSNYVEPISSLRQLIPFAKAISVDLDEGKPYPTNNEVANYPPQPINDGCADRKKELDELEKKIQKKEIMILEKENNLLQKENYLMEKEISLQKKENEMLKKPVEDSEKFEMELVEPDPSETTVEPNSDLSIEDATEDNELNLLLQEDNEVSNRTARTELSVDSTNVTQAEQNDSKSNEAFDENGESLLVGKEIMSEERVETANNTGVQTSKDYTNSDLDLFTNADDISKESGNETLVPLDKFSEAETANNTNQESNEDDTTNDMGLVGDADDISKESGTESSDFPDQFSVAETANNTNLETIEDETNNEKGLVSDAVMDSALDGIPKATGSESLVPPDQLSEANPPSVVPDVSAPLDSALPKIQLSGVSTEESNSLYTAGVSTEASVEKTELAQGAAKVPSFRSEKFEDGSPPLNKKSVDSHVNVLKGLVNSESSFLEKQIALLRKENDLHLKEIELLKKERNLLKAQAQGESNKGAFRGYFEDRPLVLDVL